MGRTLSDSLKWATGGTRHFLGTVESLPPTAWSMPSGLPGWTVSHVVAHVAANAEALQNLIAWAATGVPTPMYPTPEARAAGIARGDQLTRLELLTWAARSAAELEAAMAALDPRAWSERVTTAQGRDIPASEVPWLRTREVWIHAVDVSDKASFADLPSELLSALIVDVRLKRAGLPDVVGPQYEIAAYVTGRPHSHVTTSDGSPAPVLSAWI